MTAAALHLLAVLAIGGIFLGVMADMAFILIRNRVRIVAALNAQARVEAGDDQ